MMRINVAGADAGRSPDAARRITHACAVPLSHDARGNLMDLMDDVTIVLIEDNSLDEALTLRALAMHKFRNKVVVLRDGAEALEYLLGQDAEDRSAHSLPRLILLDLKLPKIDGLEVLRRIRAAERTRLVPVVILTSSKEDRDVLEGYRNGTNSYVQKPVDFTQFSEAIRQLGRYWLFLHIQPSPAG
jgi:two-component system response regulator